MEWEAVRHSLQAVVPASYWTALECHENGAWSAYTPGLPVNGGEPAHCTAIAQHMALCMRVPQQRPLYCSSAGASSQFLMGWGHRPLLAPARMATQA